MFFAWEETFEGDDYLVYGLDEEWLLAHPEVTTFTRRQQFDAVHAAGGCVIQAHPFRCRDYISRVHLALPVVDGVEVANGGNAPLFDAYAYRYAQEYGLLMTAGSDNHFSCDKTPVFGIATEERLGSIHDLVRMIMERRQPQLLVPEDRLVMPEEHTLPLECEMLDTEGQAYRYHQPWLEDGPFAPWLKGEASPWTSGKP